MGGKNERRTSTLRDEVYVERNPVAALNLLATELAFPVTNRSDTRRLVAFTRTFGKYRYPQDGKSVIYPVNPPDTMKGTPGMAKEVVADLDSFYDARAATVLEQTAALIARHREFLIILGLNDPKSMHSMLATASNFELSHLSPNPDSSYYLDQYKEAIGRREKVNAYAEKFLKSTQKASAA